MVSLEWEEMGSKKSFPGTSTFDRVNHYDQLNVLTEHVMPKGIIMLLFAWFSLMSFCVQ